MNNIEQISQKIEDEIPTKDKIIPIPEVVPNQEGYAPRKPESANPDTNEVERLLEDLGVKFGNPRDCQIW